MAQNLGQNFDPHNANIFVAEQIKINQRLGLANGTTNPNPQVLTKLKARKGK